jgi:hypothetical protein
MLKPKNSQSSGCSHVHQTFAENRYARKLLAAVFWVTKKVLMVEFMQRKGYNNTRSVLQNTRKAWIFRTKDVGAIQVNKMDGPFL